MFAERKLDEWCELLEKHPLIWAPVLTLAEAVDDPQAHANGVFSAVDHPRLGSFATIAPPIRMSGWPMRGERPAPELGADAEAVLAEAGLSADEIARALTRQSRGG